MLLAVILDFVHGSQYFADRPGLGYGAMRREGWFAFENFAECTEAVHVNRNSQGFEKAHGFGAVAVDAQVREHERSQQPAPDRALMIGGIAILGSAGVVALVSGLAGGEAAQPIGREQMLCA